MSKQIDKIKKIKVKSSLLKGNTAKQALKDAGYSLATAEHSTGMTVIKCSQAEIIAELTASDVTVDSVIRDIEMIKQLALKKQDYATAGRMAELKGKYLAMFTDKTEVTEVNKQDNQFSLDRLSKIKLEGAYLGGANLLEDVDNKGIKQ